MFMHITTHLEGRKHDDLLSQVGGRGFPSFFILDAEGRVVGQHNGDRTVEGFAATAKAATDFVALEEKAAKGDKAALFEVTLARARMGQLTASDLTATLGKMGRLTAEQETEYKGVLAGLLMEEVQRTAVGDRYLQMEKDGLVPTDEQQCGMFYYGIWTAAAYRKDAQTAEHALTQLRQVWGDNDRYKAFLANCEKQLAAMKEGAKKE